MDNIKVFNVYDFEIGAVVGVLEDIGEDDKHELTLIDFRQAKIVYKDFVTIEDIENSGSIEFLSWSILTKIEKEAKLECLYRRWWNKKSIIERVKTKKKSRLAIYSISSVAFVVAVVEALPEHAEYVDPKIVAQAVIVVLGSLAAFAFLSWMYWAFNQDVE